MATTRATTPGFRDPRYRQLIGLLVNQRKASGLTQQELAERLGIHKQFVSRYELGERRLDVIEFADIADALGLKPHRLLQNLLNGDK